MGGIVGTDAVAEGGAMIGVGIARDSDEELERARAELNDIAAAAREARRLRRGKRRRRLG